MGEFEPVFFLILQQITIMTTTIKIKQGLDIKLKGEAERSVEIASSGLFALQPTDFVGVLPRLFVQEGDAVEVGTPLFQDKHDERILFTSPVKGTVKEIRRGEKRLLQAVVIDCRDAIHRVSEDNSDSISNAMNRVSTERETIIQKMLETGLWPMIRQRPYSVIANPDTMPKAFFVSGFDTHPLAPDLDFIVEHFPDSFQKGLEILSILSGKKVHLCVHAEKTVSDVLLKAKNVTIHMFSGPHPSGNIGTQINKIDPINKGELVWYCSLQDVVNIGHYFRTGELDFTRIYAVAGSALQRPHYFRTKIGAQISALTSGNLKDDHCRLISGNVLTGRKVTENDFVGFYHNMVSVIPEGDNRQEMFGWIWPGFKKFSVSRTFPSGFIPKLLQPDYELDTNTHGEERPFVVSGEFEKVFPFDIYPLQLIKACIVEDIDLMENLGIYEVDEEDFALCEFIDTSKTDIQQIIRKGLNLVRKENE